MSTLLQARGLSLTIGQSRICDGFDWRVEAGQCWGILGANGVGKTTLLLHLCGLLQPSAGEIRIDDRPLTALSRRELAQRIGILLQQPESGFPQTVMDACLSAAYPHLHWWQGEGEPIRKRARQVLDQVQLSALSERPLGTLSGGERRRLEIAMLLMQNPRIWLADEPTNHLDLRHQLAMVELLVDAARQQGGALLMTLHDANLATRYCSHLLLMLGDGQIVAGEKAQLLNPANLQRVYRQSFVELRHAGKSWYLPE